MKNEGVETAFFQGDRPTTLATGFTHALGQGGFGRDDIAHQPSGRKAGDDTVGEDQQILRAKGIYTGPGFLEQIVGAQ